MTIQFKPDAVYTLGNANAALRLICTYIEDNTVWFKCVVRDNYPYPASDTTLLYKLDRKKGKLYVFNTKVQAWDSVEGGLAEYGSEQVWESRKSDDRVYDYLE